jgi:hypothetical protein
MTKEILKQKKTAACESMRRNLKYTKGKRSADIGASSSEGCGEGKAE